MGEKKGPETRDPFPGKATKIISLPKKGEGPQRTGRKPKIFPPRKKTPRPNRKSKR